VFQAAKLGWRNALNNRDYFYDYHDKRGERKDGEENRKKVDLGNSTFRFVEIATKRANIYLKSLGSVHLNSDVFSCAAILAGGATIFRTGITNALLGVLLFHSLFIVSPQAGQNVFGNPALGEYFRSVVAFGTIAFALMMHRQATSFMRKKNYNK
jgi:hypothetical protein